MKRREDVLKEALEKNAQETERWKAYKADNEVAIQNLSEFSKHLTVEVMVPIGKKALMPGELIHTNELFVGHYQGYFSSCSAHKAQEICQHRLNMANERLKKLKVEADLWQNNLETPHLEGALPKSDEIEIVEEYNEEEHQNWLREHKERVRKEKQEERAQREASANAHDDVLQKLEERELLEELGLDPNNINEQALHGLLQSEVQTNDLASKNCDTESVPIKTDEEIFEMLAKLEAEEENESSDNAGEIEQNLQATNEILRNLMSGQGPDTPAKQRLARAESNLEKPKADIEAPSEDHVKDDEEEESDLPDEVKLIRQQMELLPSGERQEFLHSQLQIIKAKMRQIQKVNFISDELTHLMNVVVCLEDDMQEMLFEQAETASTEELSDDSASVPEPLDNKKRRISFATSDQELLFKQEETVAEMLKRDNSRQPQREIIKLDGSEECVQNVDSSAKPTSPQILQKVEKNLEFVHENQSVQDFDLVNQILEASTGLIKTLHISFNHSDAPSVATEFDKSSGPSTPAHFYEIYKSAQAEQDKNFFPIYVNSYEGEEQLKVPIIKEEERSAAYDDPRLQFNKISETVEEPAVTPEAADTETKSILRNKSAVELEPRAGVKQPNKSQKNKNRKGKKQRTLDDDLRDMSAYQKVMQDLVEKEPTAPEPLPEGKFIDTHTPKKRISRFKEQRSLNKT